MAPRKKKNYVNNADFCESLIEYKKDCEEAENQGDEKPVVPNYIAECFYQIARNMAKKPNFSQYTFKDDMIMDAVENCLLYMHNFDENKTRNPFAYFSQYAYNAFIRRITLEKKQLYLKYKSSQSVMNQTYIDSNNASEINANLSVSAEYINDFIEDYENSRKKKNVSTEDQSERDE